MIGTTREKQVSVNQEWLYMYVNGSTITVKGYVKVTIKNGLIFAANHRTLFSDKLDFVKNDEKLVIMPL